MAEGGNRAKGVCAGTRHEPDVRGPRVAAFKFLHYLWIHEELKVDPRVSGESGGHGGRQSLRTLERS